MNMLADGKRVRLLVGGLMGGMGLDDGKVKLVGGGGQVAM